MNTIMVYTCGVGFLYMTKLSSLGIGKIQMIIDKDSLKILWAWSSMQIFSGLYTETDNRSWIFKHSKKCIL